MKKSAKSKRSAKPKEKVSAAKKRIPKKKTRSFGAAYYAQSKRLGFRLIEAGDEALYLGLFTDAKTMEHVCPPLAADRAKESFGRALSRSSQKSWTQRISVVVERRSMKPVGIASIKIIDTDKRIAEVGILLAPNSAGHRYATEASQALITSAFRRHTIDGISAQVPAGHKIGERLVATLGYSRGQDIAPTPERGARTGWTMSREQWANSYK